VVVVLPAHFEHVAAAEGLSVQLTPRSAGSKGVAATRVSIRELEIVELHGGKGAYDVDYVVHGVRRGQERFEVVRLRRPAVVRKTPRVSDSAGPEREE
jgi:hypothetical protein